MTTPYGKNRVSDRLQNNSAHSKLNGAAEFNERSSILGKDGSQTRNDMLASKMSDVPQSMNTLTDKKHSANGDEAIIVT